MIVTVAAALTQAAPTIAPQAWNCTGVDDRRAARKFALVTNGAGEPIEVRGLEELASDERVLERFKRPTEVRLRIKAKTGDYIVFFADYPAGERKTIRIVRDLGHTFPYEETALRGVCTLQGPTVTASTPAEVTAKQRYALWWVKLVDEHKKSTDATWATTCTLATTDGRVFNLPLVATWNYKKLKIVISQPSSSDWSYGPVELAGMAQAAVRDEGFTGARRRLQFDGSAETKKSPGPLEIGLRLEETGSGLSQAVSVWTGPAKQRSLLAYGSCDPVPRGALPRA